MGNRVLRERAAIARGFLSANQSTYARPREAIMKRVLRAALALLGSGIIVFLFGVKVSFASVLVEQTKADLYVVMGTHDGALVAGEVDSEIGSGYSQQFGSVTFRVQSPG